MTKDTFFLYTRFLSRIICLSALFLLPGCASYKVPTRCFDTPHPLYAFVPRHRAQIRWYDAGHWTAWALFGNDDDGIFGERSCYHPGQPRGVKKALYWWARNPLHNFTFYVIGSAHRANGELDLLRIAPRHLSFGRFRCPGRTVFATERGSGLYFALHGGKPFISLRLAYSRYRRGDFYIGWRERGNFGLKASFLEKR